MIVAHFRTAADGIARETALLQEGKPSLLLWQADENAFVVPTAVARSSGFEKAAAVAMENGWTVTTRSSGGGIVPQGPHMLNLAMIVPFASEFTMEEGYRLICGAIIGALMQFEIPAQTGTLAGAFCDGAWNILVRDCKLAGTAQRWRSTPSGRVALIHAAILARGLDSGLWLALQCLYRSAMPSEAMPQADVHIALDDLMPDTMNITSFSGALIRAVEDRLSSLARQKRETA